MMEQWQSQSYDAIVPRVQQASVDQSKKKLTVAQERYLFWG